MPAQVSRQKVVFGRCAQPHCVFKAQHKHQCAVCDYVAKACPHHDAEQYDRLVKHLKKAHPEAVKAAKQEVAETVTEIAKADKVPWWRVLWWRLRLLFG